MARFRYGMQSILNIKLKLETVARQEFAMARASLDAENEKLSALHARKAAYEQRAQELLQGKLSVLEIADNKTAILRMEDFIRAQEAAVKKAEAKLEEKRMQLTEVMQERKMHEKLKEKAFEEFLADEKKQEGKEVDELTSYTYGQRIQEAGEENDG